MTYRMRAVYRGGAFVPTTPCNLPEEAEVDLVVEGPVVLPPRITDPEERAGVLRRLVQRMRENPIPATAPRFTRDELHERR